jgi:hypothetical protein
VALLFVCYYWLRVLRVLRVLRGFVVKAPRNTPDEDH